MTCRFPDDCKKKPDTRRSLCRGCAQSLRRRDPKEIAKFKKQMKEANFKKYWAWCPPEHIDLYKKMQDGAWSAAEAKAEVLSWGRETA